MDKKTILAVATLCMSAPSVSSIITYGDLSLDTDTNIVTDTAQNLEWLQWDETVDMSLYAASQIGDNWRVATYWEMESLITNHFGYSFGDVYQRESYSWDYSEGEMLYNSFSELFGVTQQHCYEGNIWYDCAGDEVVSSVAWFYKEAPNTSLRPWTATFTSAHLRDRTTNRNPPVEYGQSVGLNFESSQYWSRSNQGTALVRGITNVAPAPGNGVAVSEPATLGIFALLSSMILWRRKKS